MSRRSLLAGSAAAAGLVALAAGASTRAGASGGSAVAFHGAHQAGIATPAQDRLVFAAFDVVTPDAAALRDAARRPGRPPAARLAAGEPVGAAAGRVAAARGHRRGARPRPGVAHRDRRLRPVAVRRPLRAARAAPGRARRTPRVPRRRPRPRAQRRRPVRPGVRGRRAGRLPRGAQPRAASGSAPSPCAGCRSGSRATSSTTSAQETPRNLLGFKDGTDNLLADDAARARPVRLGRRGDGPALAARRHLPRRRGASERASRRGRRRRSPASRRSSGGSRPRAPRSRAARARQGRPRARRGAAACPVIPAGAHIRVAAPASNDGARILRRGYSFADGVDPRTARARRGAVLHLLPEGPARAVRAHPVEPRDQRHAARVPRAHLERACSPARPASQPGGSWGETLFRAREPPHTGARRAAVRIAAVRRRDPRPSTRGLHARFDPTPPHARGRPRPWCSSARPSAPLRLQSAASATVHPKATRPRPARRHVPRQEGRSTRRSRPR